MISALSPLHVALLSPLWPAAVAEMQTHFDCRTVAATGPDDLAAALREAEVVVIRSGVRLDRAALTAAPRLRLIIRAGTGVEGIDKDAARERGIRVACVSLAAESVAEHALGLMLTLGHQISRLDAALRAGRWDKQSYMGRDLHGRELGLVGFGRIGQRIAELARAFGMRISATDRSADKPAKREAAARLGVKFVRLEELFAMSDVVSLQTPLDDTTRGLVNARLLATMKADALLINVGRGGVVDEAALYTALQEKRLGGAAFDVFGREPVGDSPLLTLPNFVGTPHIAAQTCDTQERVGFAVLRLIDAFAAGDDWTAFGDAIV